MDKNNGGRGLRTQEQERPSVSTSPKVAHGFTIEVPGAVYLTFEELSQALREGGGQGNSPQRAVSRTQSRPHGTPSALERVRSGRALLVRSGVITYGGRRMRDLHSIPFQYLQAVLAALSCGSVGRYRPWKSKNGFPHSHKWRAQIHAEGLSNNQDTHATPY